MDFIKQWSYTVCITLIISVIFSVLTPRGSMGKFYKMILSIFILISFIYPFTDADISFAFPEFNADEINAEQQNAYSDMISAKTKEILENGGYASCIINSDIEYSDDEINVKSLTVFVPDNYDAQEVKDYVFENIGIVAEVYYIGE